MLNDIQKIFDLITKKEKFRLYILLLCSVLIALVDMAGIASILPFMAVVSNPEVIDTNRWMQLFYQSLNFSNVKYFLVFLGTIVLSLLIFSNLFKALYTWASLKYDNYLNYSISRRMLSSYLSRPYEFFLNRNSTELANKNILSDVRIVIAGVLSPTTKIVSNFVLFLLIIFFLTIINPTISIVSVFILGGSYLLIYLVLKNRLNRIGKDQIVAGTMKVRAVNDALAGIKDLKILGKERNFIQKFSFHSLNHARQNATSGIIAQLPRYIMETIAFGGILIIVILSLGSKQDISKIIPLLSIYAFAGYRLMPALQQIFSSFSSIKVSLPTLDILHNDYINGVKSHELSINSNIAIPIDPIPFNQEIEIVDVTYYYQDSNAAAVKNLNLSIQRNTSVGLVGSTGSGKTTTVDLILGLLNPTDGFLSIDGVKLSDDNLGGWQLNLGYVPQHIYLADDTVTNNIAFGVSTQDIDMEAVKRAAKIANLDTFIENELPKGYNTFIGERGLRLSGGQRQRLGIARALYRDPSVLIMDEATSALDGITEASVMEALDTLAGKKTIIMIAHRLTTVKNCDVIYILENGRIAKQGAYSELLRSSRWFKAALKVST